MKQPRPIPQRASRILSLAAILTLAACAPSPRVGAPPAAAREPSQSLGSAPAAPCPGYAECVALGKQRLDGQEPREALSAFERALDFAGQDKAQAAEAYGYRGMAHRAMGDRVAAAHDFKQAHGLAPGKLDWIEKEYASALSAQDKVSAQEISRGMGLLMASSEPPTVSTPPKPAAEPAAVPPAPPRQPSKPHRRHRHARQQAPVIACSEQSSMDLRISFEQGKAILAADGIEQTQELGKALEQALSANPGAKFILVGHTDQIGSDRYNLVLSKARAESVRLYLTTSFPALADALSAEGMGERCPLMQGSDDASQRLNRRVEVRPLRPETSP